MFKDEPKKLYLITGQSGSGKDYYCDKLIKAKSKFSKVISATTREPRYEGETTHRFVSVEQCEKDKENMVAYTFQNGIHYYTTIEDLKPNSLYIIDPPGVEYLKGLEQKIFDETDIEEIEVIYLKVPRIVRLFNMIFRRKDSVKEALKRDKNDKQLYKGIKKKDYVDFIFNPVEFMLYMLDK